MGRTIMMEPEPWRDAVSVLMAPAPTLVLNMKQNEAAHNPIQCIVSTFVFNFCSF
jgi:hypothetical protein